MSSSSPRAGAILVVNKDDETLGFVDLSSERMVAAVPLSGTTGHEVAVAPDGRRAVVPIYGNAGVGVAGTDGRTVDVIDLAARTRVAAVDLGAPVRPHCPQFAGSTLYVTAETGNEVLALDADTLAVRDRIPTGAPQAHMLALSADSTIGCTANVEPGSISILDLENRRLRAVVPVAERINRIVLSPDGCTAYSADQHRPRLAVVDTASAEVRDWIDLPGIGFGAAMTKSGAIVIALRRDNAIAVLDPVSGQIERVVAVPRGPQMVVLDPHTRRAYSACQHDDVVVEVDLDRGEVTREIAVGRNPDGICWIEELP
ncbi:YncE family protein [Microbacterium sp. NPDC055910]|uniref:YncE family protein n=1 Tax=Microbacterium sp. NPDC055910 TaxID=3345659 RepID=UPI0035D88647